MTDIVSQSIHQGLTRARICPYPSAGGILADVMGLGKTLAVLSIIVHTKEEAAVYPFIPRRLLSNDVACRTVPTGATLVIVPSARESMREPFSSRQT